MRKKRVNSFGYSWKSPRTRQERRVYNEHKQYVRGKRSKKTLYNVVDEGKRKCHQKNWKVKRKDQYRPGKRGKEHVVYLERSCYEWYITEYLEEQDIPYKLDPLVEHYKAMVPKNCYSELAGYYRIFVPGWRVRQAGYRLTYWTNKQIMLPKRAFKLHI